MAIELHEDNELNGKQTPSPGRQLFARLWMAMQSHGCDYGKYDDLDEIERESFEVAGAQYVMDALPQDRPADTYELQYDLMQRSCQDLPTQVYITPQAIMYAALNLEELGETLTAMSDAIHTGTAWLMHVWDNTNEPATMNDMNTFSVLADVMALEGATCKKTANVMRDVIKRNFGKRLPRIAIKLEHAVELADGCVDVAVVNAGLTLSLGLPGRACYDDVVISNLSKANPETGIIDKEADGKWIKGPNYKQPNLGVIIEPLLWKPE